MSEVYADSVDEGKGQNGRSSPIALSVVAVSTQVLQFKKLGPEATGAIVQNLELSSHYWCSGGKGWRSAVPPYYIYFEFVVDFFVLIYSVSTDGVYKGRKNFIGQSTTKSFIIKRLPFTNKQNGNKFRH